MYLNNMQYLSSGNISQCLKGSFDSFRITRVQLRVTLISSANKMIAWSHQTILYTSAEMRKNTYSNRLKTVAK